jgi:restriction system protein
VTPLVDSLPAAGGADLVARTRSRFVATEEARKLLATNPDHINVALLMKWPSFREFYTSETPPAPDSAEVAFEEKAPKPNAVTPEEQIETAYQAVQSVLRADLLNRIAQNSPSFFEQLIVDLLVAMGYGGSHKNAAEQLGRAGDGGIDGVINEDRASTGLCSGEAVREG